MEYCVIKIRTQTATFRIPEFFNYHKSFLVPPPTTLIGITGAALGLSPKKAQEFFLNDKFEMGVHAIIQGKSNDLWKYNDFAAGSIIQREILFHNNFILIYGNVSHEKIAEIEKAFKYPKYCLTMGSSDSLAKVEEVFITSDVSESFKISHCLLSGNIIDEVLNNAQGELEFSIYSTSDPISYELPIEFEYTKEYGMRRVIKRKEFSFIGEEMILNVSKKGILIDRHFVPLFNLQD